MNGKIRFSLSSEQQYLATFMIVIACTLVAGVMFPYFDEANLIMVYLVGVALTASQFGRRASILASILSVAAFDFFLVHPYLTFVVSDTQYLVTFAVMLMVALTISTMQPHPRREQPPHQHRHREAEGDRRARRPQVALHGRQQHAEGVVEDPVGDGLRHAQRRRRSLAHRGAAYPGHRARSNRSDASPLAALGARGDQAGP